MNEDLEENYEDRHDGVSVRGQDDVDSPSEGDDMKLDQDMSIDCDESNDSNSVDDQESTTAGDLPASLDNPLNDIPGVG